MTDLTALAQQVTDLSSVAIALTNEVVAQKARLEAAATTATTKASEASTSKIAAEAANVSAGAKVTAAASSAAEALNYKNQAAAIVGLNTVDAAVDLALAEIPFNAMTEVAFEAMRAANNEEYVASGFVHFGRHVPTNGSSISAVNEGLTSIIGTGWENKLALGRSDIVVGNSKTSHGVVNIAGVITGLDAAYITSTPMVIKFPEAEKGCRTYDSVTGISVDYSKEVDPKYGDVAPDTNEAVARAFEGKIKNSDFRNGTLYWTLGTDWAYDATLKRLYRTGTTYHNVTTSSSGSGITAGEVYILEFEKGGSGGCGVYKQNGDGVTVPAVIGKNSIEFTAVSTNSPLFYSAANDVWLSNITMRKKTVEVVTERVDMYGLEAFMEQVTLSNPFVYPNGLIQSQATTMNGITTVASNRPVTYYAAFDGDILSKGKGVDYFAASAANKAKMLADPKNKLVVMANGDLCQWRVRQRTIAGAGNGDWQNISSVVSGSLLQPAYKLGVAPQGILNTPFGGLVFDANTSGNCYYTTNAFAGYVPLNSTGTFSIGPNTKSTAYNGECYFLVLGTVSRLNQGAYHPRLNPLGTKGWNHASQGSRHHWHETTKVPTLSHKSQAFHDATYDYVTGGIGFRLDSGSLVTDSIYSPGSRAHDAIYADGLGGVIDYRMSAYDKSSPADAAQVDAMVKNGSYRGVEKLKFIKFYSNAYVCYYNAENEGHARFVTLSGGTVSLPMYASGLAMNTPVMMWQPSSGTVLYGSVSITDGYVRLNRESYRLGSTVHTVGILASLGITNPWYIAEVKETNITVSGNFTQQDVIGDPANILQCDALKDGWYGSWIPVIPDGASKDIRFTRKVLSMSLLSGQNVYTTDNGSTWFTGTWGGLLNAATNSVTRSEAASLVMISTYTAFAKQTKPAVNTAVLNGEAGLGPVVATSYYNIGPHGSPLLTESLLGKIQTSNSLSGAILESLSLLSSGLRFDLRFGGQATHEPNPRHTPLNITAPTNNSPAVKALRYQVAVNQQAKLNYAFNELVHNGANWGDDSTIHIADNTATDLNTNGTSRLIGTAQLSGLPVGWIKNKV